MTRRYTLHDTQNHVDTKRGLTLAECGICLLTKAGWLWSVVIDKTASRPKTGPDGILRRAYALQIVALAPRTRTTLARCDAASYHDATRQLLERAATFNFHATPAAGYAVRQFEQL